MVRLSWSARADAASSDIGPIVRTAYSGSAGLAVDVPEFPSSEIPAIATARTNKMTRASMMLTTPKIRPSSSIRSIYLSSVIGGTKSVPRRWSSILEVTTGSNAIGMASI